MRKLQFVSLILFGLLTMSAQSAPQTPVPLFGPVTVVRQTGQPQRETFRFHSEPLIHAPFTLIVINGSPDGTNRVSSAQIVFNGHATQGPSDFNPATGRLERPIEVLSDNLIEVELKGGPGSFIAIAIVGIVDPDVERATSTQAVGLQGATLDLPTTASLSVPQGAIEGTVTLSAVTSPYMLQLATEAGYLASDSAVRLVPNAPILRIKSSTRFAKPVQLTVQLPGLKNLLPPGWEVTVLALSPIQGDDDEFGAALIPMGGERCLEEAACATLSPSWFLATNPADPDDPILQLAVAMVATNAQAQNPLQLIVDQLQPLPQVQITSTDSIAFAARVLLRTSEVFEAPLDFSPSTCPARESEYPGDQRTSIIPNGTRRLCMTGAFYDLRIPPNQTQAVWTRHHGIDFKTKSATNPNGEQDVFNVGNAEVTPGDSKTAGVWLNLQHDLTQLGCVQNSCGNVGLSTEYFHLKTGSVQVNKGAVLSQRTKMAVSDTTGSGVSTTMSGAHLHFGTWWNGSPIDPEPLLRKDLTLFFANTPFNEIPHLTMSFRRMGVAQPSKTVDFDIDQTIVTSGQSLSTALLPDDLLDICGTQLPCTIQTALHLHAERLGRPHRLSTWDITVRSRPPVISSLVPTPSTVPGGGIASVAVVAGDPDGDLLTYAWTATCGALSSTAGPADKTWTLPAAAGTCTVVVTVTDPSGESAIATADVIVASSQPPNTPGFLNVTSPAVGQGFLTWGGVANAIRYEISVNQGNVGGPVLTTTPGNVTSITVFRSCCTSWHWFVRACNNAGCSAWRGPIGKTLDGTP